MPKYFPAAIEPKWQTYWLERKTFKAVDGDGRPKYYILDMFPYPSGNGLHVGHPEGYTATDILARYKRQKGFNVLHPMGWDAFGLPAEQYAVQTGTHPRDTTEKNVANFRRQIRSLGFSYDWDREVNTTDPAYYKWTQWIFLKLYDTWYDADAKRGRPMRELKIPSNVTAQGADAVKAYQDERRLAYLAEVPVNWCPALGTVLANEEVVNGRSERGNHPVVRMPLRQWMLRITDYAERLVDDLDGLDWPESIKEMQRNWVGKSEGAEVDFYLADRADEMESWYAERLAEGFSEKADDRVLRVFTTRPDTLFGATYMVVAPEHPLVDALTTADQHALVQEYRDRASRKSDMDRTDLAKEKTGVFTGSFAVNPVNGQQIPVWVADYVVMGYGTGAIMAVPAHDERDFAFAKKYELPIYEVVLDPSDTQSVLLKVHEWMGEWERRKERTAGDQYVKVVVLVNCGFDLDNFQADLKANKHDPVWAEVDWFYDEKEGKGLVVKYLNEDFSEILEEYITAEPDTQAFVFSLEPENEAGAWEGDQDEEEDAEEEEEYDGEDDDGGLAVIDHGEEGHECGVGCDHDDEEPTFYTKPGICVDSGVITGLPTAEAKKHITEWLGERGLGRPTVNYKLRDWLFSRQRYWGEPFPIVLDATGNPSPLTELDLPVALPDLADFQPTGTPEPPLSKAADWLKVTRDGKEWRRETNTMPQWAGSCWYYLRYLDPKNDAAPFDKAKEKYWMPVDLYVGGAEHAVLHLLYSRFWHKVLFDLGVVSTAEPFAKLVNQGMILGEMEQIGYRLGDRWLSKGDPGYGGGEGLGDAEVSAETVKLLPEQVEERDGKKFIKGTNVEPETRAFKMSKARGNVVNPDDVVSEYGADSLRLYEMFMGPLEATKPWNMNGVEGIWRFLNRVWRVVVDLDAEAMTLSPAVTDAPPSRDDLRALHTAIKGVTADVESMRFNTAISKLMEYVNYLTPLPARPRALVEPLVVLLSPFAPHMAEELWTLLGHPTTLAYEPWPAYDDALTTADQVEVAIQINNKLRSRLVASPSASDDELLALAKQDARIQELTAGKTIVKSVVTGGKKGRLVNFVVKE